LAKYAIKELEHLSGIKAHTIRIWEQRYNLLEPERTETNIRLYSDADLKTLLNVSFLNSHGMKISKIAKMAPEELHKAVLKLGESEQQTVFQVDTLLAAMIEFDEAKFDKALTTPILQYGFEQAMLNVVYPFLEKIGILWQTSNIHPAHEHFVSNLIRQKLLVAIDGQSLHRSPNATRLLLFLPEGEFHELALLFINFLARARGYYVMYLGQSLPLSDLVEVAEKVTPDFIISVFTSAPERDQVQHYINTLAQSFNCHLLLYGSLLQQENLVLPEKVERFVRINHVISRLETL